MIMRKGIETNRLILRRFTPDDLDALDRIFSSPNVMKYLGLRGEPMSKAETQTALLSIIKHWDHHGFGRWAVISKDNQSLIGCAGLRSYEGVAELVYLIDEPYWGKGLATEISITCLAYGFEVHGFDKIIAFTRPDNTASRNVMEKIGMRFVQETVVFEIFVVQYELLSKDYYINLNRSKG